MGLEERRRLALLHSQNAPKLHSRSARGQARSPWSALQGPPTGRGEGRTQGQEQVGARGRGTEAGNPSDAAWLCPSGAFYSEKLPGPSGAGRMVVLNTNLYYSTNNRTAGVADPGQQFRWLEDVLTGASRAKEMVRARPPPPLWGPFQNKAPTSAQTQPLARGAHITNGPSSQPQEGASSILTTVGEKEAGSGGGDRLSTREGTEVGNTW